jgi:hypothetical protein
MSKVLIFPADLLRTPDLKSSDPAFLDFIKANQADHYFVAASDRPEPPWFKPFTSLVTFCNAPSFQKGSRKNGKFINELLDLNKDAALKKSQIVVLGYGESDVPMYANSQSILIRCDWRTDMHPKIKKYGIACKTPQQLPRILKLLDEEHPWYFTHKHSIYDTYCFSNAATMKGNDEDLKALAGKLQSCLKTGNPAMRDDFIATLLSSLYATDEFKDVDIWTYFPSSRSKNVGDEIIADFAEIARTTFNRRSLANPLIIRHTPTAARHSISQTDRENPESQMKTIHLHPDYRSKIEGKTVAVLDDYMNHGVSFSVSAALLRAAGAAKIIAVAVGKFPRDSYIQDIKITSDPFAPITAFKKGPLIRQVGTFAPDASNAFKRKFA